MDIFFGHLWESNFFQQLLYFDLAWNNFLLFLVFFILFFCFHFFFLFHFLDSDLTSSEHGFNIIWFFLHLGKLFSHFLFAFNVMLFEEFFIHSLSFMLFFCIHFLLEFDSPLDVLGQLLINFIDFLMNELGFVNVFSDKLSGLFLLEPIVQLFPIFPWYWWFFCFWFGKGFLVMSFWFETKCIKFLHFKKINISHVQIYIFILS